MAGDIKRQRKSWTLQDRSKVSINILRANLAEEGDEDAQLDVAKRLLQESSDIRAPERNNQENARLALYWLIKSSEQGNDEATQLLQECLQSGNGLTAQNILDVRTCVTTPKYEKLTFKAARLLHRKLSNGEEFITTAQLLARMNAKGKSAGVSETCSNDAAIQEEKCPKEEENADELLEQQQKTQSEKEGNSMNAALLEEKDAFMKNVDLNRTFIVSSSSHIKARSTAPSSGSISPQQKLNRSFQHQSQMLLEEFPVSQLDLQYAMMQSGKKLTLTDLLNVAKDFNSGNTPQISVDERNKIISRHQWNVNSFFNVFIAQLLLLGVLGNLIHVGNALVYVLFLGIIWSSYNCFLWKLRCRNFKDWKLAFESVLVGDWETDKMKIKLCCQHMIPYLIIFSLGLLPLFIEDQTTVLFVCAGVLVIISIRLGIQQKLFPGWRHIIVLCTAMVYFQYPFISNLLGESFKEQMSVLHQPMFQVGDSDLLKYLPLPIDVFTLLICATLSTTIKLSLHDILNETVPDIVLTLWLIKVVHMSTSTGEYNVVLFAIFVGIAVSVIMMLLYSHLESWKVFLLSGIILIIVSLKIASTAHQEYFGTNGEGMDSSEVRFLEWADYEASCHRRAWNVLSPAATQIKCSSLYGDHASNLRVKWKGRISIVKVEKLSRLSRDHNSVQTVVFDISVGIFPSHKDDGSRNWQNFLSGSSDTETLAPASLIIEANEKLGKKQKQDLIDHILNLRTGDKIEFLGKLKGSTAGSLKPQIVDVQSIQCLSCSTADYGEFVIEPNDVKSRILNWLKRAILEVPVQTSSSYLLDVSKNYFANVYSSINRIIKSLI